VCQRTKLCVGAIPAPLQPNKAPTKPWQIVSIDVIGPLPESSGYDAVLVIVDQLTKMVIAVPTNQELSAEGTARILHDRVFTIYGIPEKIISDRCTQFVSKFMTEFYQMMEIEGNPSTAFHPQTDGQTERINHELEKYLWAFTKSNQTDWSEWVGVATFALNNQVASATGYSPFYLNHGRDPRMIINISRSTVTHKTVRMFGISAISRVYLREYCI